MNEKIKELALKVGSIGDHLWLDGRDPDEERAVEKFAELIIRECGDIALKMENHPLYEHHDCMLTHFGFE